MAWLYVPESEVSNSGSGSRLETSIEPFVTSSGKPAQRPLSWRGWLTRPWIRLLSGTTLPHSTATRGVESWIFSLRGSRASRGVSPGEKPESMTNDGYGRTLHASFARWDRDSCCWKTCQGSLLEGGWDTFSGTWPKRGSMLNGTCFQRRSAARPTSGSGCLYWPTADTNTSSYSNGKRGPNLRESAKVWPTARAEDAESCGNHPGARDSLTGATKQWQTPATDSFRSRGGDRKDEQGLDQQARFWPTPTSSMVTVEDLEQARYAGSDARRPRYSEAGNWATPKARDYRSDAGGSAETSSHLSRQAPRTSMPGQECSPLPRRLNPLFVEWLMGLPRGWTDCEPVETELFQSWLHTHTALLRELF